MQFVFPDFRGAARRLVLINLLAFFAYLLLSLLHQQDVQSFLASLPLAPQLCLHGAWWQPLTYSFVHPSIIGTLFELLSLWFLISFLEMNRNASWVTGLYFASVLGTALTAILFALFGIPATGPLTGCFGGIFGLLIAIGVLYGDVQFQLFFVIGIKARYLAAIYALLAIAMTFSEQRIYAFAQLGGALTGLAFIRLAPRQGLGFSLSENWYALRNRFYRWKRRKAAKKFEVYMKQQGRTVRFDGQGRYIDDDQSNDKKHWN